MRNFKDAIPPTGKAKKRTINGVESDIGYPSGWQDGTLIDRELMMALQGFEASVTTIGNGKVTQVNSKGETLEVTFANGKVTSKFTSGTQTITKTTTFANGKVTEVIS